MGRAEILIRAVALAPVLRERAALGETLRRPPDATIADLVKSELLRVSMPARFGGGEFGWDTLCELLIEMGRGDASQAWVASVYAAMAWQTALFGDAAQRDVWNADPDTLIAGSLIPVGNSVQVVEGGYRLTGKWPFASGIHHAHWAILGENVVMGDGTRDHLYFLVPASDYTVDDDWFVVGMSGTGSASIVAESIFVPAHRTLRNRDVAAGQSPGARVNAAPVYRMPLFGFAQLVLAAVPVGASLGMVEDFTRYIRARSEGPAPPMGLELLQACLSEVAAETRAAMLLLLDAAKSAMRRLEEGSALGDAEAGATLRDSAYALKLAKHAATKMFEASGGHALYLDSALQRGFRDVMAAGNHGSLSWERVALRYAKMALKS
jgi:alkylation response protein AidB-like acyl-CoA dehydrogenase